MIAIYIKSINFASSNYLSHSLTRSHTSWQAARDQAQEESAQKSREISRLEGEVASHLQTIAECKARIREDEMVRRKLHNTIQELKGTAIPYSWKYWRELNLAVEPKIAIARILMDLNLAVRYGIAIRIYAFWRL